jgi:hypothetical protein
VLPSSGLVLDCHVDAPAIKMAVLAACKAAKTAFEDGQMINPYASEVSLSDIRSMIIRYANDHSVLIKKHLLTGIQYEN